MEFLIGSQIFVVVLPFPRICLSVKEKPHFLSASYLSGVPVIS